MPVLLEETHESLQINEVLEILFLSEVMMTVNPTLGRRFILMPMIAKRRKRSQLPQTSHLSYKSSRTDAALNYIYA